MVLGLGVKRACSRRFHKETGAWGLLWGSTAFPPPGCFSIYELLNTFLFPDGFPTVFRYINSSVPPSHPTFSHPSVLPPFHPFSVVPFLRMPIPFGEDECHKFLALVRSNKPKNPAEWKPIYSEMRQWECERFNITEGRSDSAFVNQWYAIAIAMLCDDQL